MTDTSKILSDIAIIYTQHDVVWSYQIWYAGPETGLPFMGQRTGPFQTLTEAMEAGQAELARRFVPHRSIFIDKH